MRFGTMHARSRFDGPDIHDLSLPYENDPEFAFRVREQALDGTLVPVHYGDVEFILRTNPRASIAESDTHSGFFVGDDNLVVVSLRFADFPADATHYQLDIVRDHRRCTFAAGIVRKVGILGSTTGGAV